MPEIFESFVEKLKEKKSIDANDVIELRKIGYKDAIISVFEIRQLILLNQQITNYDKSFSDYYIEAIKDFIIDSSDGINKIDLNRAEIFVEKISQNGRIISINDLAAIRNIALHSFNMPLCIINLVLSEIEIAIAQNRGITRPEPILADPYINDFEVQTLRDIFYAIGSNSGVTISRDEAEYLFNLKDIVKNGDNSEDFKDFFVKAVANYLQAHNFDTDNSWKIPSKISFFDLIAEVFKEKNNLWNDKEIEAKITKAEQIDAIENEWLQKIIHRDNKVDDYEKAILEYIAEN